MAAKGSSGRGSALAIGLLVGLVLGVGIAATLAWVLMKDKVPVEPAKTTTAEKEAAKAEKTGPEERFQFYDVLTDKQNVSVPAKAEPEITLPPKKVEPEPAAETAATPETPAAEPAPEVTESVGPTYRFLQVGSFPQQADAEDRKATLAMQGLSAQVQSAEIPGRGTWYRVRVGPFKTEEDFKKAEAALKQNGVDYTPIRAQ